MLATITNAMRGVNDKQESLAELVEKERESKANLQAEIERDRLNILNLRNRIDYEQAETTIRLSSLNNQAVELNKVVQDKIMETRFQSSQSPMRLVSSYYDKDIFGEMDDDDPKIDVQVESGNVPTRADGTPVQLRRGSTVPHLPAKISKVKTDESRITYARASAVLPEENVCAS